MPYELKKVKNGYYVVSTETGKKHSKKPMTKAKAEAQLRVLLLSLPKEKKNISLSPPQQNIQRLSKQQKELEGLENDPEQYLKIQQRHNYINSYFDNPELMNTMREQDPIGYLKIMKMNDEDFKGSGFLDTLKASKIGRALTSSAKKIGQFVAGLPQRIVGTITGRNDYPPAERDLIQKLGNYKIKKICVYREPLEKSVNMLTNALSLGQMNNLKKKYAFDEMFHLFMIVTVQQSQDIFPTILIEKNEVINLHEYPKEYPNAETLELLISPKFNYTFKQFLDNAQQAMGDKYFTYDPFNNNCQVFIMSLISANPPLEQDNPNAKNFILQDVQGLERDLNPVTKNLFRGTTNLASRLNVLIKGYGFI